MLYRLVPLIRSTMYAKEIFKMGNVKWHHGWRLLRCNRVYNDTSSIHEPPSLTSKLVTPSLRISRQFQAQNHRHAPLVWRVEAFVRTWMYLNTLTPTNATTSYSYPRWLLQCCPDRVAHGRVVQVCGFRLLLQRVSCLWFFPTVNPASLLTNTLFKSAHGILHEGVALDFRSFLCILHAQGY